MVRGKDMEFRLEKDSMGSVKVQEEAYYGAQTQRAKENFKISSLRLQKNFVIAQAVIKKSCAAVNLKLKRLEEKKAKAIIRACDEVISGNLAGSSEIFHGNFVVDVYCAGAGTSQNMNINEVVANRALEILGHEKGKYNLGHPNDDVNLGQSTNDTIPSAIHIAGAEAIEKELIPALEVLRKELYRKSKEFGRIIKAGRTHMQDAVTMTLGQEFSGYARMVELGIKRIRTAGEGLKELNIGGNAVGTGINNPANFSNLVIAEINRETKLKFKKAKNMFEATQNVDAVVQASGSMRTLAISLLKIAQDIILLSSGPNTGLNEISLPAVQPGSSIMPGKVNPVMAEMLSMVACDAVGRDAAIAAAAQQAKLELNVLMPVIAYNFLHEIEILSKASRAFGEKCVRGIKANKEICRSYAERSLALVTVLSPIIGYEKAAEIAKESLKTGKSIKQIAIERKILKKEEADKIFGLNQ